MDDEQPDLKPTSILKGVGKSLVDDQKSALRFGRAGAIVGALVGLGLGVYGYGTFGLFGLGAAFIVCAIVGGVGAWLMHQFA